jgi:hypothetical protein
MLHDFYRAVEFSRSNIFLVLIDDVAPKCALLNYLQLQTNQNNNKLQR